jgi:uncharacterized protein (DUF2062 family)
MGNFLRKRLLDPVLTLLTQGVTPQKIALSITIGAIVGVFPVMGTTTILCTAAAAALRLNLVAVHTIHYAMTPVQIMLIIPFVRMGEWVVGAAPQPLSISESMALIKEGALRAAIVLWDATWHAMVGWFLIGPLAIVLCYALARQALVKVKLIPAPAAAIAGVPATSSAAASQSLQSIEHRSCPPPPP